MEKFFGLFLQAIYPSLISFFIFTFATAFANKQDMEIIQAISAIAAVAFFVVFLIGSIGHIALLITGHFKK